MIHVRRVCVTQILHNTRESLQNAPDPTDTTCPPSTGTIEAIELCSIFQAAPTEVQWNMEECLLTPPPQNNGAAAKWKVRHKWAVFDEKTRRVGMSAAIQQAWFSYRLINTRIDSVEGNVLQKSHNILACNQLQMR